MIKVGLVGCGGIMGAHVPGYKAVEGRAIVTAACDVSRENAERRNADTSGTAAIYSDWKQMLADDNVDAVDIALPHHLHRDAIVDAANAGKHVITEKPLCTSLAEAIDIEAAVKANNVKLVCAHNQMFMPAPRTARKWVREGKLGRVFSLRTIDCFYAGGGQPVNWGWRAKLATSGGGCAIDTGYHPAYMLISIANSEPTEVVSFMDNYNHKETLEGDDSAQTMVRFANGSIGTLQTSWGYGNPNGHWQIHAIGEKGQLYGRGNTLYFEPISGEKETHELTPEDGFVGEIKHFIDCIENDTEPEQGLYEGVTVLKVILGGYESEKTKRVIQL